MPHSSLLPHSSEVDTGMNFLSTLLTPNKKVFYIPICVYHREYTTWVWVCFLSIINTITLHASSFLWFGLVWFGFVPSEVLSSHSGDDADVSPGSQGDTVGFAHPALPLFLRVTASHPGKPWGPTLAHKARPKISKLGKLYPWAGGAAECPSRSASNQLPSHLEWRQPQGKQNQGMENEQVLKHFGEPRPPNQKPVPPRDFPGSGPNQVLFFFSGRSPKEHAGTRCWAPTQQVASLPARASVLWAATQDVLMPSIPCALTLSPSTGPASKRHWWKYQETTPSQQHTLGLHPLYLSESTGPFATYICMFCSIMLLV